MNAEQNLKELEVYVNWLRDMSHEELVKYTIGLVHGAKIPHRR